MLTVTVGAIIGLAETLTLTGCAIIKRCAANRADWLNAAALGQGRNRIPLADLIFVAGHKARISDHTAKAADLRRIAIGV